MGLEKRQAINAMLLNEFLNEHRKVDELEARMAQQQKAFQSTAAEQENEIKALTASLKGQAEQIQTIRSELTLSRSERRIVANGP